MYGRLQEQRGLFTPVFAQIKQGDEVVVFTPAYQSLLSVAKAAGATVIALDLEPLEEKGWKFPINKLSEVVSTKTRIVVVNAPHNPTGAMFTSEHQQEIIAICRKVGAILFSDEVYRDMEIDPSEKLDPAALIYEKAISLGVLSKAAGLAGLRVGKIACQDINILETISGYKHYLSICNSAPSEILSIIALRNYDRLISKNKAIVYQNLEIISGFFRRFPDLFDWNPPKGGCTAFVKWKGVKPLDIVARILVEKAGVLILPGRNYPGCNGNFSQYFRLGFGRRDFPECLKSLEDALNANILDDK